VISAIGLDNVLAFRALRLDARALTLLCGTNSAGKSSVLHSLALLRQSQLAGMLSSGLLLNGSLVTLGTGRDILHSEFADLNGDGSVVLRVSLEDDAGGINAWTAAYVSDADTLELLGAAPQGRSGGLFEPGFQYLKADRIVPAVTFPKSHEEVTVRRSLGPKGEHSANFLRVHGEAPVTNQRTEHPDAAGRSLSEQTNAWLRELSRETLLDVEDVGGTDLVRLVFRRAGSDVNTEPQRATNVGFGLTYALPIIVGCLSAGSGSLILVENPEAHLHPRGQAIVGRLCALAAAGGAQVVVETHSDHVLNATRLTVKRGELAAEEVLLHFLSRSPGVLQPTLDTLEVTPEGMIGAWPKGFFDEMDRALGELLE
jgi:predicted ATPase